LDIKSNFRRNLTRLFIRPDSNEPAIDGLRAIAVLWVFFYHIFFFHFGAFPEKVEAIFTTFSTQWIGQGDLGVDLFFVISGFLIGTILLKELDNTGAIQIRLFYARRFLRLIPVYLVVMVMGIYFMRNIPKSAVLIEISPSGNIENAWTNLLYINNYLTISKQYMGWCWSLAIEEQFYIITPFFLLTVLKYSNRPLLWMLLLLFLSGIIRFSLIHEYNLGHAFNVPPDSPAWSFEFDTIYDKLHVRYAGLLAGVLGSYCSVYHSELLKSWLGGNSGRSTFIGLVSLLIVGFISFNSLGGGWYEELPELLQKLIYSHYKDIFSIATLLIILVAIYGKGSLARVLNKILSLNLLYPISQLSYSIYLIHEMYMLWLFPKTAPILSASWGLDPNSIILLDGTLVLLMTVLTAALLYVTVERPCLEFRNTTTFNNLFLSKTL
jgi:peptidoglycan/LPS O-acetylase OafA/YrhL